MIDWDRVRTLREEVGADEFDEVVELFLEEVDSVVERLRSDSAPDNLGEDLHFLKGSALSLGFTSFSELCQNGETAASRGSPEMIDLPAILSAYSASRGVFLADLPAKMAG